MSNSPEFIDWKKLINRLNKESQINPERDFDDFDIGPQSDEESETDLYKEEENEKSMKETKEFDTEGNPKLIIDKAGKEFRPRGGLEGPFIGRSGMVYYYDSKEGKYYCPYHDMYTQTPMHEIEKNAMEEGIIEKSASKSSKSKNKPTKSSLWSRAKSLAKSKFKVYPSAYANAWAARWYKKHGGGWRKGSSKKK